MPNGGRVGDASVGWLNCHHFSYTSVGWLNCHHFSYRYGERQPLHEVAEAVLGRRRPSSMP
jgi:hypothetical protein